MKHKRIAALIAGGLGTALAVAAPVGAQTPQMQADPTSGPAGTEITVSGDSCSHENTEAYVAVRFVDFFGTSGVEEVTVLEDTETVADEDGTWSATLDTPDTTPGPYVIFAQCLEVVSEGEPQIFVDYEAVEFEVTEGGTQPTTPEPTTPTTTTPGATPTPPPAVPVEDDPPFTG